MPKDNLKFRRKQANFLNPSLEFMIGGVITFVSALFCMWLCQFSCEISLTEITTKSAYMLHISLYAIIFSVVTIVSGRIWLGNGMTMVLLFVVTMLDYQVYYFRGTEINPGDINSIRTALSVSGQYHPKITINLLIALMLLVLYLVTLRLLVKFRKGLFWRGISFGVLIGAVIVFHNL